MSWENIIKRPLVEFDEKSRRVNFEYNPEVLISILESWDRGEEDIRIIRGPTIQKVDPAVITEEGVLTESPRGAKKNLDWGFKFVTNRPITRARGKDSLHQKLIRAGYKFEVPRKQRQAQVKSEIEAQLGDKFPDATEYIIKPSREIMQGQRRKYPEREPLHPGNIGALDTEKRAKHEAEKEAKGINDMKSLKDYALKSSPRILRFVGSSKGRVKIAMQDFLSKSQKMADDNRKQHESNINIILTRTGGALGSFLPLESRYYRSDIVNAISTKEEKRLEILNGFWKKAYEEALDDSTVRNLWELYETPPWRLIDTLLIQRVAEPAIMESVQPALEKYEKMLSDSLPSSQDLDKYAKKLSEISERRLARKKREEQEKRDRYYREQKEKEKSRLSSIQQNYQKFLADTDKQEERVRTKDEQEKRRKAAIRMKQRGPVRGHRGRRKDDVENMEKSWFDALKQGGPVTASNSTPGLINNKVVGKKKKKTKKEEENEQLIVPKELDFWRD
tara:strand:- start:3551 stop:5065 length:1515 start_codon:yes stop_codon:yes gene_type:complete